MLLVERVVELLASEASTVKVARRGPYSVATLLFDADRFDDVLAVLSRELSTDGKEAEVVRISGSGRFVDMGVETLTVSRAEIFEYYDYARASVAFARLLLVEGGGKTWAALYVDENAEAPWWSEEGEARRER